MPKDGIAPLKTFKSSSKCLLRFTRETGEAGGAIVHVQIEGGSERSCGKEKTANALSACCTGSPGI